MQTQNRVHTLSHRNFLRVLVVLSYVRRRRKKTRHRWASHGTRPVHRAFLYFYRAESIDGVRYNVGVAARLSFPVLKHATHVAVKGDIGEPLLFDKLGVERTTSGGLVGLHGAVS